MGIIGSLSNDKYTFSDEVLMHIFEAGHRLYLITTMMIIKLSLHVFLFTVFVLCVIFVFTLPHIKYTILYEYCPAVSLMVQIIIQSPMLFSKISL